MVGTAHLQVDTNTGIDKSPSELLCNQKFRTNLPMIQHASE